ncbi:MAG: hypothetical protein AAF726_05090 [Planctomycetota bacterium]
MSRAKQWTVRVVLVAVSTVAALAAAEFADRVWRKSNGQPYDRTEFDKHLVRSLDKTRAYVPAEGGPNEDEAHLHPYAGSEIGHDPGDVLATFRSGVPDDVYTIVVVGGSVAVGWSVDSEAFQARLVADPRFAGKRVQVLSYAHAAYKQPQQLTRLAYLLSFGYRPDAVINLDGFNEIANGYKYAEGGMHPLYPSFPVWAGVLLKRTYNEEALALLYQIRSLHAKARRLVYGAIERGWTASSLAGRLVENRLLLINSSRSRLQAQLYEAHAKARAEKGENRELLGPPFEGGLESALDLSVTNWVESSRSIQALCEARGIYYLHCLQPTLLDPGSKPLSTAEKSLGPGPPLWREGIEAGYPRLRTEGARLAEEGVAFVDLTGCFKDVSERLYIDGCHVIPAGNRILSGAIADAFLADLP